MSKELWVGGQGVGVGWGLANITSRHVRRKKCRAKSCIEVQENGFGERWMRFRRRFFSQMDLGNVDAWKMYVFT